MNLFINWFEHPDPARQEEFRFCYDKNFSSGLFENIINLQSPENQPTYSRFFEAMAEYPDDVNVLANLDIYFDRTLELANKITTRQAYCLTRWEYVTRRHHNALFYPDEGEWKIIPFESRNYQAVPYWSQDAWIVRGGPDIKNANFSMGQPGCDNRVAWCLYAAGYQVRNPCMSIRAIHVHASDYRDDARNKYSVERPYKKVYPERL